MWGTSLLCWSFPPKTAWYWKILDWGGGVRTRLDPPMLSLTAPQTDGQVLFQNRQFDTIHAPFISIMWTFLGEKFPVKDHKKSCTSLRRRTSIKSQHDLCRVSCNTTSGLKKIKPLMCHEITGSVTVLPSVYHLFKTWCHNSWKVDYVRLS